MTGRIYLLQDNGSLQAMSERSYVTEERLQLLLKDYPDLLAGDQMDEQNPRRWLLVSREVGVPIEEGGGDWMSLDHRRPGIPLSTLQDEPVLEQFLTILEWVVSEIKTM
jgi:hypothetical protein